jgi:hypothetical protein
MEHGLRDAHRSPLLGGRTACNCAERLLAIVAQVRNEPRNLSQPLNDDLH